MAPGPEVIAVQSSAQPALEAVLVLLFFALTWAAWRISWHLYRLLVGMDDLAENLRLIAKSIQFHERRRP